VSGPALPTTAQAAAVWSVLHHDIDPRANRLVWSWLRFCWVLARPIARLRIHPIVLTVLGADLAIDAVWRWSGSGHWIALLLVLASALCDALDGAVAVLTDRASRAGARADKVADRISDLAFAGVIWRCGAPAGLAVAAGIGMLAVEGFREFRAGLLRARITVGERPTRVICTVLACACAALSSATWPATVCAAVLIGLSLLAVVQLNVVLRRVAHAT
jgi:phosphatidylglycerophosphate synthase